MEKVILLSASANKLSNLKQHAGEYASLIMEELDPDHLGYIEVRTMVPHTVLLFFCSLLQDRFLNFFPNRCGNWKLC